MHFLRLSKDELIALTPALGDIVAIVSGDMGMIPYEYKKSWDVNDIQIASYQLSSFLENDGAELVPVMIHLQIIPILGQNVLFYQGGRVCIEEYNKAWLRTQFDVGVGFGKVFWGTTYRFDEVLVFLSHCLAAQ